MLPIVPELTRILVLSLLAGTLEPPYPPCILTGTVVDVTPDHSPAAFDRLASVTSDAEFIRCFDALHGRRLVTDAPVHIRSGSTARDVRTDSQGRFTCPALPAGKYEVSAETPLPTSPSGATRTATGSAHVELESGVRDIMLELRADRVTITGRVTDDQGRPVAGAKVIGIQELDDDGGGMLYPHVVSTISRGDGTYELTGLDPPHVYNLAGYLNGGTGTGELGQASLRTIIRVAAPDLRQTAARVPRFPLITAEQLDAARRLLDVLGQLQARHAGKREISEKPERGPFPPSHGNVITGVDVVLESWPRSHVSGRLCYPDGQPAANRQLEFSPVGPALPGSDQVESERKRYVATDDAGEFELPDCIPGPYAIIAYGTPPASWNFYQVPVEGARVDIEPGRRAHLQLLVRRPEDYAISGRVLDAAGRPVPGVWVSTADPHGFPWHDTTDADGRYRLVGLDGTGRTTFRVSFSGPVLADVPLNAENVDLVIPGRGAIEGAVREAESGAALGEFELEVPRVQLPDGRATWEHPAVVIERRSDGGFRIRDVPAGRVEILVKLAGRDPQPFCVRVTADATATLDCPVPARRPTN